jgi:hypothetical protein
LGQSELRISQSIKAAVHNAGGSSSNVSAQDLLFQQVTMQREIDSLKMQLLAATQSAVDYKKQRDTEMSIVLGIVKNLETRFRCLKSDLGREGRMNHIGSEANYSDKFPKRSTHANDYGHNSYTHGRSNNSSFNRDEGNNSAGMVEDCETTSETDKLDIDSLNLTETNNQEDENESGSAVDDTHQHAVEEIEGGEN